MARSRNIKPGFFTNDELAELPALTRLLFIGLWTLVDREGRIEDRPKKIKAECMPYDDMDADAAIQSLADSGFLLRYEAQGVRCIQVQNWDKHQNPHVKEVASTIPAHPEHKTSTRQAPDKEQPKPERAGLIPDSGFLIPDSIDQCTHTPLRDGWALPKDWGDWAMAEFPHLTAETVRSIASQFADHWRASGGCSADWQATWQKWCRDPLTKKAHPKPREAPPIKSPSNTVPMGPNPADDFHAKMDDRAATATKPPPGLRQRIAA